MEKKYKLMIIGAFPNYEDEVGGELIKNRILAKKLEELGYDIKIFNTNYNWRKCKANTAFQIFWQIFKYQPSHIILSVASTGAIPFLRRVNFVKKIFNFKLFYFVIGGAIGEKASNNLEIKYLLSYCDQIFVQTLGLKSELNSLGIRNVIYLPNFKEFNFKPTISKEVVLPLKMFFFSRIIKEKGIELAVKAVKIINNESKNDIIKLDIYGPVEDDYQSDFKELLATGKNIRYQGIMNIFKEESYKTLAKYDLMIFPTYHSGEGFPGVILDALIAGVPIIASDWKYNGEIIKELKTGRLFRSQNIDDLIIKIKWFIDNKDKIPKMKENCIKEAQKYHIDKLISKVTDVF
jgi:glycosyltransferase involved in cell wall biosynthesis